MRYLTNKKLLLAIVSLALLLFVAHTSSKKAEFAAPPDTNEQTQKALQNTELLQENIRMKFDRAASKDCLSVIAQSDKTIYSIYTYEEQDVIHHYIVQAKEQSEGDNFTIEKVDDLRLGYTHLAIPDELIQLLDKQIDVTLADNEQNLHFQDEIL